MISGISRILYVFLTIGLAGPVMAQSSGRFEVSKGVVQFKSDAPLELIEASSKDLKGLMDFEEGTFAFSVTMTSFEGFNSGLQREHFNENYMESEKFPRGTFSGRMIEIPDLSKNGDYTVRAKGKLLIHGVEQERIIKALVKVTGASLSIESSFTVLLQEHEITIPKVVQQKIAEEIYVTIQATAVRK